jgi:hypothetical protein
LLIARLQRQWFARRPLEPEIVVARHESGVPRNALQVSEKWMLNLRTEQLSNLISIRLPDKAEGMPEQCVLLHARSKRRLICSPTFDARFNPQRSAGNIFVSGGK